MQSAQDDPDLPAARLDSPIARAPPNVSGELPRAHGMPIATGAGSRLRAQAQRDVGGEGAWLWTRGIPFVVVRHLPTRFGLLAGVALRLAPRSRSGTTRADPRRTDAGAAADPRPRRCPEPRLRRGSSAQHASGNAAPARRARARTGPCGGRLDIPRARGDPLGYPSLGADDRYPRAPPPILAGYLFPA